MSFSENKTEAVTLNHVDMQSSEPKDDMLLESRDDSNYQRMSRAICRKLDIYQLPLLITLYTISYLDRGNIGNVKAAGAQTDLGLNSQQWSWVLLSFYITYTPLEWLVLVWKLLPAHIYVAFLAFGWGVASMCSGAVSNLGGLIVCRIFVAIFEAGFGAGVPYFMSLAYKRSELGLRIALLMGSSPLANCIAGALAYGISQIKSSIQSWRWIMIIEGLPAILVTPVVYFLLMDNVKLAKFLTEEQKTFAVERLQTIDSTEKSKLSKPQMWAGLRDYKNYCHALLHFCCNYSFAALSNFLPTIIAHLGYTSIQAQGFTAPPYLAAAFCCIFGAVASDRYRQRGWFIAGFATMGTIGYALLVSQTGTGVRYAAIFLAACGIFPALALNVCWMLDNQAGETKKGIGMSMLTMFGQCSSFIASEVFPDKDAPYYITGTAIGCGLTGLVIPITLFLHFKFTMENKRRDRSTGRATEGVLDVSQVGDAHEGFRYYT